MLLAVRSGFVKARFDVFRSIRHVSVLVSISLNEITRDLKTTTYTRSPTFSTDISLAEYLIPFTRTGTSLETTFISVLDVRNQ